MNLKKHRTVNNRYILEDPAAYEKMVTAVAEAVGITDVDERYFISAINWLLDARQMQRLYQTRLDRYQELSGRDNLNDSETEELLVLGRWVAGKP